MKPFLKFFALFVTCYMFSFFILMDRTPVYDSHGKREWNFSLIGMPAGMERMANGTRLYVRESSNVHTCLNWFFHPLIILVEMKDKKGLR
jgi:hypothetical protein